MDFVRRFVNFMFYFVIVASVITGVVVLATTLFPTTESGDITVKTMASTRKLPKVKYIPTKSKSSHKIDISNAILTPRAKRPVVITL